MTRNSPVLIIKLAADKTRYSVSLVDKEDSSYSYLPSEETPNVYNIRRRIRENVTRCFKHKSQSIKQINASKVNIAKTLKKNHSKQYSLLDEIKINVGIQIFTDLGTESYFKYLWKLSEENGTADLIIATNDHDIPWEWASNGKEFLCERFAVGRIFLEDIDEYTKAEVVRNFSIRQFEQDLRERNELKFFINSKRAKKHCKVALIYDSHNEDIFSKDAKLSYTVRKEIDELKSIFSNDAFQMRNIIKLDGQKTSSKVAKKDLLKNQWVNLSIIHFALYGNRSQFYFQKNRIRPSEFIPKKMNQILIFKYKPLVVFNLRTPNQLLFDQLPHTRFVGRILKMGAGGCLVSWASVSKDSWLYIFKVFYSELIQNDKPYGLALRDARIQLKNAITERNDTTDDAVWLYPILIGDPSLNLFPRITTPDEVFRGASEANLIETYGDDNIFLTLDDYFHKKGMSSLLEYLDQAIHGKETKEKIREFTISWQAVEGISSYLFHQFLGLDGEQWGGKRSGTPVPDGYVIIPDIGGKKGWCFIYDCKSTKEEKVTLSIDIKRQMKDYLESYEVNVIAEKFNLKYFLLIGPDFDPAKVLEASNDLFGSRKIELRCMDISILKRFFLEIEHNCPKPRRKIKLFDWGSLFKDHVVTEEKVSSLVKQFCEVVLESNYHQLPIDDEGKKE